MRFRRRWFTVPPGYFGGEWRSIPLKTDGVSGMPCSDCCHAAFGQPPRGVPQVTVNWPCSRCGKTAGMAGGYHHRQTCGTPLSQVWREGE